MKDQDVRGLEEIIKRIKIHKKALQDKFKIKELGIFGSFARGEQKKRSDVDIFVEFKEEDIPGFFKFIAIERYLERILKKKVELVRKGAIRAELKEKILKEVIYV